MNERSKFTEEQKIVVDHTDGPLIVVAGAGTGKTHTIVGRILALIENHQVNPENIAALTFTEKARDEMQDRVSSSLPIGSSEPFIATFHSFADHLLRSHGFEIGIDPEFTLLKNADLLIFLRQNRSAFTFKYFKTRGEPTSLLMSLSSYFGRLQDEDVAPADYSAHVAKLVETAVTEEEKEYVEKHGELANLYGSYLDLLTREGKMDYAGLTYHALQLLKRRPTVAQFYAERFKYVIVDEYQDTNIVQNLMVDLIARRHRSIMVVGDDDQAIYKWRGASLYNILSFQETYPDAKSVALRHNFRSTQPILDCSYAVIQKNNPHRLEVKAGISKKLISTGFDATKKYDSPELHHFARCAEEIEFVLTKTAKAIEKKKTVAILARTNALLKPYIEGCVRRGIPYETSTTITLIQKPVVKDMIAFLRVVLNPWDDLSLYRLLAHPCFGIQMTDLHKTLAEAKLENTPLFTFLTTEAWHGIKVTIQEMLDHAREHNVGEVIGLFLKNSGYLEYIKNREITDDVSDLAAFSEHIKNFEETHSHATVADFLEYIHLADDIGSVTPQADSYQENGEGVVLMTVHAAKGLEFDCVFIVGAAQNKFPTINRSDAFEIPDELIKEKSDESAFIQEERRLFYVACTRAKQNLYLTWSDLYDGTRKFKPSVFCEEARASGTARLIDHTLDATSLDQLSLNFDSKREGPAVSRKNGKDVSLSYSQLSTFETCPKKYHYRYELHLPEPPNAHLSFGVSVHNALRDFSVHLMTKAETGEPLFTDEDREVILQCLSNNWINRGFDSREDSESNKVTARECLLRFFDEEKKRERIPAFVEKSFNCSFDGVRIGGRIDRIDKLADGTYEIIDYKTGKSSGYNIKNDLQLSVYALAARDSLNIVVSKYTLMFLESGEEQSAVRSDADIELCKKTLRDAADSILVSDFEATPGFHCNYCPYRFICPFAV